MAESEAADLRPRTEGGGNLRRAALACGALRPRSAVQPRFFLRARARAGGQSVGMAVDASPQVAAAPHGPTACWRRGAGQDTRGVAMRAGCCRTSCAPPRAIRGKARRREYRSWAREMASGLGFTLSAHGPRHRRRGTHRQGVYNVVDDDPLPGQRLAAGVRQERRRAIAATDHGRSRHAAAGEDAIYYGTELRGVECQGQERTGICTQAAG